MLSDLTINDAAAAAKTFKKVKTGVDSSAWIESTATGTDFREIFIKTQTYGKGPVPNSSQYRYLISASHSKYNATTQKIEKATVNFTVTWATVSLLVRGDFDHLVAFVKNYLTTGAVDSVFRREL